MKHTPILIISIKNSQRINILKDRLKKLDLNYNTIIGIDGEKYNKKKGLN